MSTRKNGVKIDIWADKFRELYKDPDGDRAPEEFWNAVMAHLSGVGEAIRKTHYLEMIKNAVHAFCWMVCFVNKCNEVTDDPVFYLTNTFSEVVGLKYPLVCGHCLEPKCVCDAVSMDKEKDKSAKYHDLIDIWKESIESKDFSIAEWLGNFKKIYASLIHIQTIESIGFHLLEEAGEEAKAVRSLVRFRRLKDPGTTDRDINRIINERFFEKISNIEGLVGEYRKAVTFVKKMYRDDTELRITEKKAKGRIDFTSNDAKLIKARLVFVKMDFVVELADTFSWFCALMIKLEEIIENQDLGYKDKEQYMLEYRMKQEYNYNRKNTPIHCYSCGHEKCECIFI